MSVDLSNMFRYPNSKLLGNLPCGKNPTPQIWLNVGAPKNQPQPLRDENCGTQKGCTPRLRFIDGDNDLAMSRKILKQSNNRDIFFGQDRAEHISPLNYNTPFARAKLIGDGTPNNPNTDPIGLPQTPFRLLMNAADPIGSNNAYVLPRKASLSGVNPLYTGAINQVSSTRRASNAAAVRMSGVVPTANPQSQNPVNNSLSAWSGNNRWVYDGADYIRFKKLQAKNRNFNDVSWGGDRNNASQTALSRVRH